MKLAVPLPLTAGDSVAGWAVELDVVGDCADAARLYRARLNTTSFLITDLRGMNLWRKVKGFVSAPSERRVLVRHGFGQDLLTGQSRN
jgi:hypothetical protein